MVEIMVTVALIIVIMGFLFQFILGAQRVWTGSRHIAETMENAQVVMSLLEHDLRNMMYSSEPEMTFPRCFWKVNDDLNIEDVNGNTYLDTNIEELEDSEKGDVYLAFFASESNDSIFPIFLIYAFDKDKAQLNRFSFEQGSTLLANWTGLDPKEARHALEQEINTGIRKVAANPDELQTFADNRAVFDGVRKFRITVIDDGLSLEIETSFFNPDAMLLDDDDPIGGQDGAPTLREARIQETRRDFISIVPLKKDSWRALLND